MEFLHGGQDFIRDAQDLEKVGHCRRFIRGLMAYGIRSHM